MVAAGAAFALAGLACAVAFASYGFARAFLAAATLVFAVVPATRLLLSRGRRAVVQLAWDCGGVWRIRNHAGGWQAAQLLCGATLGPWTLLVWKDPAGWRRYVLLDAGVIGGRAHSVLRARLRLARSGADD